MSYLSPSQWTFRRSTLTPADVRRRTRTPGGAPITIDGGRNSAVHDYRNSLSRFQTASIGASPLSVSPVQGRRKASALCAIIIGNDKATYNKKQIRVYFKASEKVKTVESQWPSYEPDHFLSRSDPRCVTPRANQVQYTGQSDCMNGTQAHGQHPRHVHPSSWLRTKTILLSDWETCYDFGQ